MIQKKNLINKLKHIKNLQVNLDIPLKKYTSFKVGGPTDIFLIPGSINSLKKALAIINNSNLPYFVLGKGSNVIAGDKGFRGIIIYTGKLNTVKINNNTLKAECGLTLNTLAEKALNKNLTGLEFISGIPGSLGGALYMNAGAYGKEIQDIVKNVLTLTYDGREKNYTKKELAFNYRHSILQEKPLIAVRATLKLKPGKHKDILSTMKTLNGKRKTQQPLSWPSAGSTFKRPTGHYAGSLIEKAGLKGTRVGDAQVSPKHAGFIINLGDATARDIYKLIEIVQHKVLNISGIKLEVEPILIGDFN